MKFSGASRTESLKMKNEEEKLKKQQGKGNHVMVETLSKLLTGLL